MYTMNCVISSSVSVFCKGEMTAELRILPFD